MADGELLAQAYSAAWQQRQTTGDTSPWVLRREIDRRLAGDAPPDEATQEMVALLMRAWTRGTPPERLWRPMLWSGVTSTLATVRLLYLMLRTPKEFKLPRGVVKVGEVREDEEDFAVESALPFRAEAGTQAVLAWAWPITHDPADLDDIDDVPVWLDVIEGTDVAAVMIGERRVGTTTVPEGTYDALRGLDRRRKRCVPDGSLDLRRLLDGRLVVEHLDVELP